MWSSDNRPISNISITFSKLFCLINNLPNDQEIVNNSNNLNDIMIFPFNNNNNIYVCVCVCVVIE